MERPHDFFRTRGLIEQPSDHIVLRQGVKIKTLGHGEGRVDGRTERSSSGNESLRWISGPRTFEQCSMGPRYRFMIVPRVLDAHGEQRRKGANSEVGVRS
jgi:hypothetical protein